MPRIAGRGGVQKLSKPLSSPCEYSHTGPDVYGVCRASQEHTWHIARTFTTEYTELVTHSPLPPAIGGEWVTLCQPIYGLFLVRVARVCIYILCPVMYCIHRQYEGGRT